MIGCLISGAGWLVTGSASLLISLPCSCFWEPTAAGCACGKTGLAKSGWTVTAFADGRGLMSGCFSTTRLADTSRLATSGSSFGCDLYENCFDH